MVKMTKKKDRQLVECFTDGPSDLVFWSFRYFLGRRTIHACSFAKCLSKAWTHLDLPVQKLIMKELEEAFERDDVARSSNQDYRPLGDDIDREAWQTVRDKYWQRLPYDHPYRKQLLKKGMELIYHDSHGEDGGCSNSHS